MEIPDSYQPCIAEAQRAATEGEWDRVGELMGALCERAIRDGDRAMAGSAAVSEADALRRAERPGEATRAIRRALDLVDDPETRALQELQFIAVLLDTGRLDIAEQIGRERVAACPPGPYRTLALDSLCGVLLSRGDVAGLASLVVQLEGEAEGPMSVAARFRRAQLDRLGGRLEDAAEGFGDCMASLDHRPGALGAWAAACSGLAGVALLKGDVPDALSLYDRAADAWARAGRRSGEWRVLSGRARASLRLGASTFLPNLLDSGVRYARERHLMLLEVELLTTRALCLHSAGLTSRAREDLETALKLADACGARLLAGRTRYELHRVGAADREALRRAVLELTEDRPWCARAMTALAGLTEDPDEAAELAGAAVCRFTAMGMNVDADVARGVLGESAK
jgi:tetratricopeptide (TPR) repeat protein